MACICSLVLNKRLANTSTVFLYTKYFVLTKACKQVQVPDWPRFYSLLLQNISLSLEDRDAEELILVLCGYHRLLTERDLEVIEDKPEVEDDNPDATSNATPATATSSLESEQEQQQDAGELWLETGHNDGEKNWLPL